MYIRHSSGWFYLIFKKGVSWHHQFKSTSWSPFSLKKTVGHINYNKNKTKHIPHVGLCSFTGAWLFALKIFTHLRKSYLRSTMGHVKLSNIAIINIEKSYANRIYQKSWIKSLILLENEKIFSNTCTFDGIYICFNYFVILC